MRANDPWIPAPAIALDRGGPADPCFAPLPDDWVDLPVARLLAGVAGRFAGRIAIEDGAQRLTYADVLGRAAGLARALEDCTAPGAMVAVALPHGAEFAVAALACLAARRPFVAIDLGYPPARIEAILDGAGIAAAILPQGREAAVPGLPAGIPVLRAAGAAGEAVFGPVAGDNDDPAVVLSTSGSTGRPKRIVNSAAALLQRVLQYANAAHLTEADRFLTLSSPCTIAGLREMLTPLLLGGRLVVVDARQAGLGEVRRRIGACGVTVYNSTPALLRALLADGGGEAFATVRLVRLGGDALFWPDLAAFRRALRPGCLVQIGFSSTEATGAQWFVPPDAVPAGATVPVGYLLPGNSALVLDEDGRPVGPGEAGAPETGALVLSSRFVLLGQWEDGRLVPGSVRPDPADPRRRILPTGDLVRLHPSGLLEHVGRVDRQVKVNGQRAEPAELEAALRWAPYVADAAVISSHAGHRVAFIAFVVPAPGAPADLAAALRRDLRSALPGFLRPARIHVVAAIPLLPGAKPDVAALAELDRTQQDSPHDSQPMPRDPVSRAVARAWRAALGRPAAGASSFEAEGGDSLRLMQFVLHLEFLLRRHLPLDLFDMEMHPADAIHAITRPPEPAPAAGDQRPLVVLLPGLNGDEPLLAQFRAALRPHVRFLVAEYPDWPEMLARGRDFAAFVAAVEERLEADVRTGGKLLLAGYSFGGAVAAVLAERLAASGRPADFLAILDTNAVATADPDRAGWARLALRRTRRLLRGLVMRQGSEALAEFLAQYAAHPAITPVLLGLAGGRRLGPSGRRVLMRLRLGFHGWMRIVLRSAALRDWQARFGTEKLLQPAPVLFRSEAHPPGTPDDLGWGAACPGLRIVRVQGGHHSMLAGANRDLLSGRFLTELLACTGGAEPHRAEGAGPAAAALTAPAVSARR